MTQRVRTGYRNHRRTSWVVVLAVAATAALAALAVVLPALGAAGDTIPPPSDQGVLPTDVAVGGSNFSCTTNTGNQPPGMSSFSVSSPPNSATPVTYNSTNSTLPAGVSLTLTGFNQAQKKNKFFNFTMTGANMFHVGVKGGNDVAWYNYFGNASTSGGVQSDGNLHATMSGSSLFNASFSTFCFSRTTTIKGRVFLDNNGDGAFNTSATPPDAGQNGWTVKLFDTSTNPAVQVGSSLTTPSPGSDPAGNYTFTAVPIGGNYKVCVTPPSGTWDQTAPVVTPPNGNTACSSVSGALPAGRVIQSLPATGATGQDFGNQPTFIPSCTTNLGPDALAGSQIVEYTAQLTNPNGGTGCKDAVIMYSFLTGSQPFAVIHPTSGAGPNTYWVVERIRMMVDKGGVQNPVTMDYDDSSPYGSAYTTMKMCTADPRVSGENFKLAENPADVMPAGTTADGGPHTTCMIQSTDLPSGGITDPSTGVTYNYEAYMATNVDGIKRPT